MATTAAADRRDPTAPRRPFRTAVDIADVVDQEIWQGDLRDLSVSGMSVRSAMVPEVGEELACRFRIEGGEQVESRVEVVWAKEGGARDGAFGVRFTALDDSARDALMKLIPPPPPAPTAEAPKQSAAPSGGIHENCKVRVVIPGMEAPLRARVRTRVQDALIVGSDLTFLKLGERVTVDGGTERAEGNITAVDIEVDGRSGVPRLILTIDGDAEGREKVPAAVTPASAEPVEAQRDTKVDAKSAPCAREVGSRPKPAPERASEPASATRVLATGDDHPLIDDEPLDTRTWAQRAMEAAKEGSARFAAVAVPAAKDAARAIGGAVGGALDAVRERSRGERADAPAPRREARAALNRNGLRRQHAVESEGEGAALPMRSRRTMAIVGGCGVAALGLVVYAATSGPKPQAPRPQVVLTSEAAPSEVPSAIESSSAATPTADPTVMQPAPRVISGAAGAITPDLRSAAEAPSVDHDQPVRVTTRSARVAPTTTRGRLTMGNPAIRAGTLLRLRMDGPITRLDGPGAIGSELVIRVPGRRSLDLGAPLVRLDNRIVTASVHNSAATGMRLRIGFRTAAPSYSARVVGNSLHIVLAATPGVRSRPRARR